MDLNTLQHEIDRLFAEMIDLQEKKVLEIARGVEPHVTRDDLWNICNHPGLEKDPYFQYEDGHLAGLMAARIAVAANLKEASSPNPNPAGRDPGRPSR
jgi:hypothetical protein